MENTIARLAKLKAASLNKLIDKILARPVKTIKGEGPMNRINKKENRTTYTEKLLKIMRMP